MRSTNKTHTVPGQWGRCEVWKPNKAQQWPDENAVYWCTDETKYYDHSHMYWLSGEWAGGKFGVILAWLGSLQPHGWVGASLKRQRLQGAPGPQREIASDRAMNLLHGMCQNMSHLWHLYHCRSFIYPSVTRKPSSCLSSVVTYKVFHVYLTLLYSDLSESNCFSAFISSN